MGGGWTKRIRCKSKGRSQGGYAVKARVGVRASGRAKKAGRLNSRCSSQSSSCPSVWSFSAPFAVCASWRLFGRWMAFGHQ